MGGKRRFKRARRTSANDMKMSEVPRWPRRPTRECCGRRPRAMSRRAFSSCVKRMNQTEVMVNQPKTCGTMLRSQLAVRCDRTWMYALCAPGTSGVVLDVVHGPVLRRARALSSACWHTRRWGQGRGAHRLPLGLVDELERVRVAVVVGEPVVGRALRKLLELVRAHGVLVVLLVDVGLRRRDVPARRQFDVCACVRGELDLCSGER